MLSAVDPMHSPCKLHATRHWSASSHEPPIAPPCLQEMVERGSFKKQKLSVREGGYEPDKKEEPRV